MSARLRFTLTVLAYQQGINCVVGYRQPQQRNAGFDACCRRREGIFWRRPENKLRPHTHIHFSARKKTAPQTLHPQTTAGVGASTWNEAHIQYSTEHPAFLTSPCALRAVRFQEAIDIAPPYLLLFCEMTAVYSMHTTPHEHDSELKKPAPFAGGHVPVWCRISVVWLSRPCVLQLHVFEHRTQLYGNFIVATLLPWRW